MQMTDFFWNLFEKSGNIDAFMAYKEFNHTDNKNTSEQKYNFDNRNKYKNNHNFFGE